MQWIQKKNIYINKKQNYYWIRVQSYKSNSIINPNNKEPDKKNKWKIILGIKGLHKYPHNIAHDVIKNNKIVTVDIINDIMSYCNIKVSEKEFIELLNLPKYSINTKEKKKKWLKKLKIF